MNCLSIPTLKVWCCIITLVQTTQTMAVIRNSAIVHQKVACESNTLEVECGYGEAIYFLRANYGRTSLLHCNGDNIQWDVDCVSPESNEIMQRRCDGKPSCEVPANYSVFGDPCYGTQKYLEMDFQCKTERAILLYTSKENLRGLDLSTTKEMALSNDLIGATAIDYHYMHKLSVITNVENQTIYSVPLWSGKPITPLVKDVLSNGVAVDWIHDNIYWTDVAKKSVEVGCLDGNMRRTLFRVGDVDQPSAIALHPIDGWIFWISVGSVSKMERAGMDGTNRKLIVSAPGDSIHTLAIELDSRKIYWANGDLKEIYSVNFDGSDKQTVFQAVHLLQRPFSMDIFKDKIYWTEGIPSATNIFRTDKYTVVKVNRKAMVEITSIKIHHSSKQPPGDNRCGNNNGGCSHLCLPTPRLQHVSSNYTCACSDAWKLSADGATCIMLGVNSKVVDIVIITGPSLALIALIGIIIYVEWRMKRN